MVWHIVKNEENDKEILIGYSHENSEACDGVLRYNKDSNEIDIIKLSESADAECTKRLFGQIYYVLRHNITFEDKRRICIG